MIKKITVLLVTLLSLIALVGCSSSGEKLNIKPSEVSKINLTKYNDPDSRFSMDIPEGWEVSSSVMPDMSFTIHAYKPEENSSPKYHVYMQMKLEIMLSPEMKAFEKNMFGGFSQYAILYDAPVNEDGTVKGVYKSFNDMIAYMNAYENGYADMIAPVINDFEVIEEYEYNSLLKDYALDDKIVRATYIDVYDGSLQQGLFTGTVVQSPLGSGTYSVYNINFISAPDADFPQYEELLTKIFASIEFSNEWVKLINNNSEASYQSAKQIGESLQATVDECNRAWEERNNAYDIISQKQSDATLGYERVTDVETGEIYKAYNGFSDDYKGERYIPISDDMYTSPIAGYIEK